MEKDEKKELIPNKKTIQENDSGSKTYIDSLYQSNINEKENLDLNKYHNITTEIYVPKINHTKQNSNNKKEKNFYLALNTLNKENSLTINTSKTSQNLLSKISEFSIMNPDVSKDYNVSKYLHHPIMKQIIKLGNQIIKKQTGNEYRVYNGLEINKPLVSVYNMKNIFEKFNTSYIGLENGSTNSKNSQKETINTNNNIFMQRKKLKYFHRKNKSSITNYYFNGNNNNNESFKTMNNCKNYNNRKKFAFHFRNNFSSLFGGKKKIIFRDRDSATTITKEENNKDIHIHELNDINININIFNNNKNLEVIKDFEETTENRNYSTNKKIRELQNPKTNIKGLVLQNIFKKQDNNFKTFKKTFNLSTNKTLRKKYERTDFALKNIKNRDNQNNNVLMKNLINKFEQCYKKEEDKNFNNSISNSIEDNSDNKNNETFIVKDVDNNIGLNLEVSENNNNNIPSSEMSSNKFSDKNSNHSNKSLLKLSNINPKEENSLNFKKLISNSLINSQRNPNNMIKDIYETPSYSKGNNHDFDLFSPFQENISKEYNQKNDSYNSKKINKKPINYEKEQSHSVFDYTFYEKLLQAESIMTKRYKLISKNELKLNTELRLEVLIWMMKTCEEFAFKRDTYHNACYYFDMYLTLKTFNNSNKKEINLNDKSELQLIGLTCIVISAKLEEIQLPQLKEYAELLSNKFNKDSIIEMEKEICSMLRWKLMVITRNIWLSWYICQWDLFVDTVDNTKKELLKLIPEDDILYFKKTDNNSYYNFRKICQLIDIMVLDFHSYNYESRILIAISFFIILCNKYNLKYNFIKKKFDNNKVLSKLILDIYSEFILQSFDFSFTDENLQKGIKYFYKNYINFEFIFDLPLLYQIHPNKMDGDCYEDFLTYQTTNDNFFKAVKEKIYLNKNEKKESKKLKNKKKNNCNIGNIIFHKKTYS